jgi:hypothetical protein
MPKPQHGPSYDPTFRGGMGGCCVLPRARASLADPVHPPAELAKAHPLTPAPATSQGFKSIRKRDLDPHFISFTIAALLSI